VRNAGTASLKEHGYGKRDAGRLGLYQAALTGVPLLIQRVFSHRRAGPGSVMAIMILCREMIMIDENNIAFHVDLSQDMLDGSMHK
jgi:hypothetical protein